MPRWFGVPTPGDAKLSLPGCAFARSIELLDVARRHVGIDDEQERHVRHEPDRREIAQRVVRHLHAERGIHREPGRRAERDRVAVGRRFRAEA